MPNQTTTNRRLVSLPCVIACKYAVVQDGIATRSLDILTCNRPASARGRGSAGAVRAGQAATPKAEAQQGCAAPTCRAPVLEMRKLVKV